MQTLTKIGTRVQCCGKTGDFLCLSFLPKWFRCGQIISWCLLWFWNPAYEEVRTSSWANLACWILSSDRRADTEIETDGSRDFISPSTSSHVLTGKDRRPRDHEKPQLHRFTDCHAKPNVWINVCPFTHQLPVPGTPVHKNLKVVN